jgi:hypothetical protein
MYECDDSGWHSSGASRQKKADSCCSKCTLRLLFAVLFTTADYDPFSMRTVTFKTANTASSKLCVDNLTERAVLLCDLEVNFPCNGQHNTTN